MSGAGEKRYQSASQRLLALPEVFTGSEAALTFGWTSGVTSTYLANWRKAGFVRSLGGRSDVHMNLLVNRQVNPLRALKRAYPRCIRIGVDVLREAAWTTQIPQRIEVAIPKGCTPYAIEWVDLTARTESWFKAVEPGIEEGDDGPDSLSPIWALGDMIARALDDRVRGAWLLDPEDLVFWDIEDHWQRAKAAEVLGIDPAYFSEQGYSDLYERHRRGKRTHPASR